MSETAIRQRIENWAKALSSKNVDRVMSLYAADLVSFDVDPPLRFNGLENKRRAWERFFAVHTGPLTYEVHELEVTTQGELAFVHSLNNVKRSGASDLWVRWTGCFRRSGDDWRVVHEHVSVPADVAHGKAVLDAVP